MCGLAPWSKAWKKTTRCRTRSRSFHKLDGLRANGAKAGSSQNQVAVADAPDAMSRIKSSLQSKSSTDPRVDLVGNPAPSLLRSTPSNSRKIAAADGARGSVAGRSRRRNLVNAVFLGVRLADQKNNVVKRERRPVKRRRSGRRRG